MLCGYQIHCSITPARSRIRANTAKNGRSYREGETYEEIAFADCALLRDGNWCWYVSPKCKCCAADQRGSFAQSRANQCRREGILSSRLLSPRLLSSPLLWRLLSPWLRLRWLWLSSPLLVALRSSHLPLVMSQAEALGLSPGAFFMQRLTLGRRDEA